VSNPSVLFRGGRVFDGASPDLRPNCDVLVVDGSIAEVGSGIQARADQTVDCGGRVLMPGMIDAHVHVYATSLNVEKIAVSPATYRAHYAATFLRHILSCGFTTVRDTGGADVGLYRALEEGLCDGPRLFYGGRIMSQTGGHGDFRPHDQDGWVECCGCPGATHIDFFAAVVDGPDAMRRAVREELRKGAHHIKIMGSGGVASPNDPIDRCQFTEAEILAAVEECERHGAYVLAHCHPTAAVRRCVELGVRCIEHGTVIDAETARFVASKGAFIVPTMSVIFALLEDGLKLGLPPVSYAKLQQVSGHAISGLRLMREAGVKMGFGTDLLGVHHVRHGTEFTLRAQALSPFEILRSACATNAEIVNQPGKLGCIAPGAHADILVVDGNPLDDIAILAQNGDRLAVIMKAGRFHKRTI
jgi:imidazolonepropionase-like amidohydrolase